MSHAELLEPSLVPLPRPLMTGEVLDAAFRLFRAGLLRTLPYSGLAALVFELPAVYATFAGPLRYNLRVEVLGTGNVRLVTWSIVGALATALIGMITLRLNALSRSVRPRFRREIPAVLKRWPAALIATIAALGLPLLLFSMSTVITNILSWAGLILVGVPLLWPTALFIVTLPAFWCDGLNPVAAIAQSWRVSRRRSWRMFGALLASACMIAVFYLVSVIILWMLLPMLGRADLFMISAVSSMLVLIVVAIGLPFALSVLIVAHEDLKLRERLRREPAA